jgi:hypothetical protein
MIMTSGTGNEVDSKTVSATCSWTSHCQMGRRVTRLPGQFPAKSLFVRTLCSFLQFRTTELWHFAGNSSARGDIRDDFVPSQKRSQGHSTDYVVSIQTAIWAIQRCNALIVLNLRYFPKIHRLLETSCCSARIVRYERAIASIDEYVVGN